MNTKPLILQAIDALKSGEREEAVALLRRDLAQGPPDGERWRSVALLAQRIGEVALQLEAGRRYAATPPPALPRLLQFWGDLAAMGRSAEALAAVASLSDQQQDHPAVLHFRATIAGSAGDAAGAQALYRRALAAQPDQLQSWFALAMLKRFTAGDPDLQQMEHVLPRLAGAEPGLRARFLYGLAKAWDDVGDPARAFALYAEGAALRRAQEKPDLPAIERMADALIRDFTPAALAGLMPSGEGATRALFVNGLPRSGTTLVEQILVSHSAVRDGGEINLARAALLPTLDYSLAGAFRYQQRHPADPWGAVARTYNRLLGERFGPAGLIVDKTLGQSHIAGLLLHAMPGARMVWLRRAGEDTALSTYRTFFTSPVPWSWSLSDIGQFHRIEARLHAHWQALFPDRILTVPYEELAGNPREWIGRILHHFDLPVEEQVFTPHQTVREVRTASVQQVRAPIGTDAIGKARPHTAMLEEYRRALRG
ncbi:tetratricopeptide repeat-containing sulfotransferase family protein [Croceibacterium ferulae]|uniref:tetratricopeptide repeat-containing sulfotransferase family protein n=1 Tax=Croceibacterium ferulae TaxID=1854641 RepID=UPI000EB55FF2|nr:sulfotransferase [Croceibacterium ferulae]